MIDHTQVRAIESSFYYDLQCELLVRRTWHVFCLTWMAIADDMEWRLEVSL